MYASWNSLDATKVKLSSSRNGTDWTQPVVVNDPTPALLGVSSDVTAHGGMVTVAFGLTNANTSNGRFGRQFVALSPDRGQHFGTPLALGPRIDYRFAAVAGGIFPGDYVGSAMTEGRMYAVWAVSGTPPRAGARFHQVLYGASIDTAPSPVRSLLLPR
jgi:hypothetical protein